MAAVDESAIRHTVGHPQWAEAAIFIARLIVDAIGKLEEVLWPGVVPSAAIVVPHKQAV